MWTVSYAQNTSMTLDNLPEQLQKNLEAAGLADLTVDQREIIRRFLAGERTLVSGHDGAGKLTALVIGFAAKALASRRSLETGRLPERLLITNHPEDAIVAAALFERLTHGSGLKAAGVSIGRNVPRMREIETGIDFAAGPLDYLEAEFERSGLKLSALKTAAVYRVDEFAAKPALWRRLVDAATEMSKTARCGIIFTMGSRSTDTERLVRALFPSTNVLRLLGRWREPDILEAFRLVKRRGRLAEVMRLIKAVPDGERILVIAGRKRAAEFAEVFLEEKWMAPGVFEIYTPADAEQYWTNGNPKVIAATEVLAKLFPDGFFDHVIFGDLPTSAARYEECAAKAAFPPSPERPRFGRVSTIFLASQIADFVQLRNDVGSENWGLLNETGAKLADEDVQYLDNGENQQLRERACWTALRDRLPTTEIPGYPEAIQCGTPSAAVTQELPQAVPVSVSSESSRADTEELIEKKPQKKPVRRKTRKSTPVETQTEAQKTAEPVIEETPVETALAPQALPASSIVVTGDLPADVPETLSAAEKAEDAFEKETAQEVGEEDDLFAQEDHEEVEPVSKADNTDEDFSWIEEAYGAEDGTDEAEDLGDETDEDESFDDEEDDGGYEAHFDDDSEAPHRRTLTIRAGYVPHAVEGPAVTITEPLSSNTVELRAAQARMRREMKSGGRMTHQMVGKRGTIRRQKQRADQPLNEIEGILSVAQPGKKKKAGAYSKKNTQNGQTRTKEGSKFKKSKKQGLQKTFKKRKQMVGEQPPVLPAEENRDLLLLPMTTPPVADGITEPENPEGMPKEEVALSSAVLQGDDRPNEQKQQKPRKEFRKGRGLRSAMMKRREAREAREAESREGQIPAMGERSESDASTNIPPEKIDGEAEEFFTQRSGDAAEGVGGFQADAPRQEKRKKSWPNKKFKKPFKKKTQKFREAGDAGAGETDRFNRADNEGPRMPRKTQASRVPREDINDDNFGNSIHYRMKSERKTQAMPWQTTSTYGAEDRPTTLSFAQMMPESADRTGLHTVFGSEDGSQRNRKGKFNNRKGGFAGGPKNYGQKKFGKYQKFRKKSGGRKPEGNDGGESPGSDE